MVASLLAQMCSKLVSLSALRADLLRHKRQDLPLDAIGLLQAQEASQ